MKECRYCGGRCNDQAETCSNCGGTRFLSEEEIYAEKETQREYKSKRAEYEHKRKSGIIRLAAIAGGIVVVLIVAISLLTNDGSGKVSASTGMDKTELKEAYQTAETYMQQGDYENAITYFSLIQGYKDSDQQLKTAQDNYKSNKKPEILNTAQTYINNNEYDKAIATLEAAEEMLPNDLDVAALLKSAQLNKIKYMIATFEADDTRHTTDGYAGIIQSLFDVSSVVDGDVELSAKKNEFISLYRTLIFDQAETALNETGYEAGLAILSQGAALLQSDDALLARMEEYKSYKPVYLTSLDYFNTGLVSNCGDTRDTVSLGILNNCEDNLGVEHQNVVMFEGSQWSSGGDSNWYEYLINQQYRMFSGTLFIDLRNRDKDDSAVIKVYLDDILRYTSPEMTRGVQPVDFSIDVAGVTSLKIEYVKGNDTRDIYIADAILR